MAKTLSKTGITTNNTIEASHVTQSIDAFTGVDAYDITLSGSLAVTGSITGQPGIINQLTASFAISAISASHEIIKEVSSSHANVADTASGLFNTTSISIAHITASGGISSSGTIVGSNLSGTNTGDQNISNLAITGSNVLFANITSSGNISSSGNIIANNFTASNAFHVQAGGQFEFTISASQFNMVNQAADKNLFFLTTTGTGGHHFGTNNVNSQVVIGTGGHITSSGNISASSNITADKILVNNLDVIDTNDGSPTEVRFGVDADLTAIEIGRSNDTTKTISLFGPVTASGDISSSATSTASFGTYLGDGSQLSGISGGSSFPFSGSAVITGSLFISGSQSSNAVPIETARLNRFHIKTKQSFDLGFLGSFGGQLVISSSDHDFQSPLFVLERDQLNDGKGIDLWAKKDFFAGGASMFSGKIRTIFSVTGSSQTGNGGLINLGNSDVTLTNNPSINLFGHLTASAGVHISASATSTASFGTYLGDGSQLSGISAGSSIDTGSLGDTTITGSLTVSGSDTITNNITSSGYMLITSSNTGGSANSAMTPGLVINQLGSSQNHSGPAIRLANPVNSEETNIFHQPGGSGASNGNALNIITDGGINIQAGDDIGSGGAFFRLAKGQALFTIDDDSSAPRTDVKIHNGNGGTAYSRLSLGASTEYWYIEADDNNTPFNIGFDNGSSDTDVITFTKHNGSLTGSFAIIGGPLTVTGSLISSGSSVDFAGSTQLILNYDDMPTSDPSVKGQVYRNGSNQLFISAG